MFEKNQVVWFILFYFPWIIARILWIVWGESMQARDTLLLNTKLPEQYWSTGFTVLYPLINMGEKWSWQGKHPEKTHKWSASLRPLRASLNQYLKPKLKCSCPMQRARARRPKSRQAPNDLRQVPCYSCSSLQPQFISSSKVEPKSIVVYITCFDCNI